MKNEMLSAADKICLTCRQNCYLDMPKCSRQRAAAKSTCPRGAVAKDADVSVTFIQKTCGVPDPDDGTVKPRRWSDE